MFSPSPPTHPKISCGNYLHIWEKNSTWTEEEVASSSGVPLRERGAGAMLEGVWTGGLDSEQRKKASPLLFPSPLFLWQQ